jgi:hypothetical protein
MTFARQRYFHRVNASIAGLLSTEGAIIAARNAGNGRPGREAASSI